MNLHYREHICSARWRLGDARLGELEAAGHRCRTCYEPGTSEAPLEVHHRTYERFGCEAIGDLTALCRDCHRVITDEIRRRRYVTIRPRIVDTAPLYERQVPLFDPTVGVNFNEYR
ncbi:HNH endonuclease [Bradyrhizobium sp. HKCCYLR20261]|uniref:HNH endonuclease n=1 Tax=Bradyrhizobium sp. HKCCYLR20261 TaxID=3420760 RepID=UPI003EC14E78